MEWAHTTEVDSLRFQTGEHGRKCCKCPPPPRRRGWIMSTFFISAEKYKKEIKKLKEK
jgi:hypothetical protein